MLTTLGIIGGFLGVGAALDRVISDDAKAKLFSSSKLLDQAPHRLSILNRASNLVAEFFFRRITLQGVISVSILSCTVLFFAVSFQYVVYKSDFFGTMFEGIENPFHRAVFFLILLVSVIATDIVSFLQTKVMIGLAKYCRNIFEIMIIVAAELLTTMAVFSIVFSIGIVFLIAFVNGTSQWNGPITVEISNADDREGMQVAREELEEIVSSRSNVTAVTLHPTYRPRDYVQGTFYIYSNREISEDDVEFVISDEKDSRIEIYDLRKSTGQVAYKDDFSSLKSSRYSYVGQFDMVGHIRPEDFDYYFTAAFSAADSVQDTFPGSVISLLPGWYRIWMIDLQAQSMINDSLQYSLVDYPAYCREAVSLKHVESLNQLENCDNWLIASNHPSKDLQHSIRFWWYGDRGNVPIYTAFISSLTMTFVIYFLFAIVLIVGTTEKVADGNVRLGWLKTKEHPFTIALGALGMFLGTINLWVSLATPS